MENQEINPWYEVPFRTEEIGKLKPGELEKAKFVVRLIYQNCLWDDSQWELRTYVVPQHQMYAFMSHALFKDVDKVYLVKVERLEE
jgi:hypothetical protein